MSRNDWYRNTEWDASIQRTFEEKLRRARNKSQYLRIQAGRLADSHPTIALQLLERYFGLGEKFDWAQAYCDQANALLSLGRIDDAITSYESALQREAEFPQLQTQAYIELPFLIATRSLHEKFDRAVQVLLEHEARLMFPIDRFMWHAAMALIATTRGDRVSASEHGSRALTEARQRRSGFRFHPTIGLVPDRYDGLIDQLTPLTGKPLQ